MFTIYHKNNNMYNIMMVADLCTHPLPTHHPVPCVIVPTSIVVDLFCVSKSCSRFHLSHRRFLSKIDIHHGEDNTPYVLKRERN